MTAAPCPERYADANPDALLALARTYRAHAACLDDDGLAECLALHDAGYARLSTGCTPLGAMPPEQRLREVTLMLTRRTAAAALCRAVESRPTRRAVVGGPGRRVRLAVDRPGDLKIDRGYRA